MRAVFLLLLLLAGPCGASVLGETSLGRLKHLETDEEISHTLVYIAGVLNAWKIMKMKADFGDLRGAGTGDRAALTMAAAVIGQCTADLDAVALLGLAAREANNSPESLLTVFLLETLDNELARCRSE